MNQRCKRWNLAATFAIAGGGYGPGGKWDPLLAYGQDLDSRSGVLVYRMLWHSLFLKNLDFYGGTAVYTGSENKPGWLLLNKFAHKDVLWLRLTYYLL